jgi:predicted transcriptional regulator
MPDGSPPASIDLDLVTKIVAAFVRRNQVAPDQLANVIAFVFSGAWATWQISGRTGR